MDTDRIDVGTLREIDDTRQHFGWIVDDRARVGARDERAIWTVGAIRERLARGSQARGFRGSDER